MSDRWVIPWLFKVQAATIDWGSELVRLGYEGPLQETDMDPAPLQLRWLLHPTLGLPREAFMVWRSTPPAIMTTPQQLANELDWEPLELVGLPVDDTWANTGYALDPQGPLDDLRPPVEAAHNRLARGAPRLGWGPLNIVVNGAPVNMAPWEPSDLDAYLKEAILSKLTENLQTMLRTLSNPSEHAQFTVQEVAPAGTTFLKPRLLGGADDDVAADQPAQSRWHPLGLLTLAVSSEPLASLAYGFGTALYQEPDRLFMVTVRHHLVINGQAFEFELADVVRANPQTRPPDVPRGLTAGMLSRNHRRQLDGPLLENVGLRWERPKKAAFLAEEQNAVYDVDMSATGQAASYSLSRYNESLHQASILLTPRSDEVRGWQPFVAGKPANNEPLLFMDQIARATTLNQQTVAAPTSQQFHYGVAAQDIFGRWSRWRRVDYQTANESPQIPAILSVTLDPDGLLTVDISWDWAERSPEFIELSGAFEDAPNTPLLAVRLQFGGQAQATAPAPPATVVPLDADREEIAIWGAAQDRSPLRRGVRAYRLTLPLNLSFAGLPQRVFRVQARGQCHLHQAWIPNWNISPFGPPARTMVYDPRPLDPPEVDVERSIWASLPDASGASRAILRWPGEAGRSYVLYEATETALLDLLPGNNLGTDTAVPFIGRLNTLRTQPIARSRSAFRRVQQALIPASEPQTSFEVTLPPGSRIMHFYALTVMSPNQVESAWPNQTQFFAVAAQHLVTPFAPTLAATPQANAIAPAINLRIELPAGPAVSRVELYRTTLESLAADVDHMGPPIQSLPVNGPEVLFADAVTPGWRPYWYRAVAWAADDADTGAVGGRSLPSPAMSAIIPPDAPPDLHDLRIETTTPDGQAVLVSWISEAPTFATPYGAHHVIVTTLDATQAVHVRQEKGLGDVPQVAGPPPTPPADLTTVAIVAAGNTSYYAWLGRPVPGQSFDVTVKVVDPLGRISLAQLAVPDVPVIPAPLLSAIHVVTVDQDRYPDGNGLVVIGFQIESLMDASRLAAYQLAFAVDYPDPLAEHPCRITQALSALPTLPEAQAGAWIAAHEAEGVGLLRLADVPDAPPYRFRAWCFSAGFDYDTTVTLTAPDGRTASVSHRLD